MVYEELKKEVLDFISIFLKRVPKNIIDNLCLLKRDKRILKLKSKLLRLQKLKQIPMMKKNNPYIVNIHIAKQI